MNANDSADRIVVAVSLQEQSVDRLARIRKELTRPVYQRYLKRAHAGSLSIGEEWDEFVSGGCASRLELRLTVEEVTGGNKLGMNTEIELRPAERVPDRSSGA